MSNQKYSRRSVVSLIVVLVVAGLVGFIALHRQTVYDYIAASQYKPNKDVTSIKDKLNLTQLGSLYFDASDTRLEAASDFNKNCEQQSEANNPVLGCYVGYRIYAYSVTNTQLAGIEETTIAHELLHAAYQRMTSGERAIIDKEVEAAYEKVKTPELESRVAYYSKVEPGQKLNELHSILGTEFHDLGPALEAHYKQYFNNRQQVVGYYDQYSAVFRSVTTRLTELTGTINQQTSAVNSDIDNYNKAVKQLNADVQVFNQKNSNGGFSTQAEFNDAQHSLIDRQSQLDAKRSSIQAAIQSIEDSRSTYNQLVDRYNELNKSISSLAPSPSL